MTREEAIQKIQNDLKLHHDYLSGDYRKALRIAIEALQQPEVIRCKDCKYRNEYQFPPKYDIKNYCEKHEKVTSVENFCSWAERKEE